MEKFNLPDNDPYKAVDHSDLTDAEISKIMGEKLASAFFDEIRSAENNNTLDEVPEANRAEEFPTIEEIVNEIDKDNIDAEIAELTDDNIHEWLDISEK